MLPSFISHLHSPLTHPNSSAFNAVFPHNAPLGNVHAHWWPPRNAAISPRFVLLFIPGNPGLIEFYTPFLNVLHNTASELDLAILAHGHADHAPDVVTSLSPIPGLTVQVQGAIEAFDTLKTTYPGANIVLVGHSVGSWICSQVLKARFQDVCSAFLLFPTLSHIGATPNGQRLWRIFTPASQWIIPKFGYLARMIPLQVLSLLFKEWPKDQLAVLKGFISSPRCIEASLKMADDEMRTIKELDLALLESCKDKIRLYYAEHDDWVGDEKSQVLKALHSIEADVPVTVTHDQHGIPHAFCINHSEQLAVQCLQWLNDIRKTR